jgi:predicted nuclease with TOPRIM domain
LKSIIDNKDKEITKNVNYINSANQTISINKLKETNLNNENENYKNEIKRLKNENNQLNNKIKNFSDLNSKIQNLLMRKEKINSLIKKNQKNIENSLGNLVKSLN